MESREALNVLFEDMQSEDAKRWYSQSFSLHDDVLVQSRGGPCGVLAAVQAHIVLYQKFLLPGCAPAQALQLGVFEILQRASSGGGGNITLMRRVGTTTPSSSFSPLNDQLELVRVSSVQDAAFTEHEMFSSSSSPAGVMLFVLSLLLTKTVKQVVQDMDDSEAKLTGRFGHCGPELINLVLTGRGSSQLHDFAVEHGDSGLKLHGVYARPRIGLLTQLETYRLVQVGSFLKNPEFPIWVVASESHFTVLYSEDVRCDEKTGEEKAMEHAKRVFHTRDAQDNGFVQHTDLRGILMGVFMLEDAALVAEFAQAKFGGGNAQDICLWSDFWQRVRPVMLSEDGVRAALKSAIQPTTASVPTSTCAWDCAACTFANTPASQQCDMCQTARPAVAVAQAAPAAPSSSSDWACASCTMMNLPVLDQCMMCGATKPASSASPSSTTPSSASKTLVLYHINGLQRTVQGATILPSRSPAIRLTTVDPELAFNGSNKAFEEVLQTKWTGAVFAYDSAEGAPSIVG